MDETDTLWQSILDEEKNRLSTLPVKELLTCEDDSLHKLRSGKTEIEYFLIHEKPDDYPGIKNHSFILCATRKLLPIVGIYRRYYSGFSIDDAGTVIPLPDDAISRYD
jgi:hypothetical protein